MKIGFIATRLSGTDGVSLEVAKWASVLQALGHQTFYCAGELGGYAGAGTQIPRMHFQDSKVLWLTQATFSHESNLSPEKILNEIHLVSNEIKIPLIEFIRNNEIDLLIAQNIFAIPMHLPLAHCLAEIINETGIATIAHHHDFYWERERFQTNLLPEFIESVFPPNLPSIQHVCINSIAQRRLKQRRGIDSIVIPNVFDFEQKLPEENRKQQSFRSALQLKPEEPLIVQPTRVIQRKGIELAIELVSCMDLAEPKLFITHAAGDEGLDYWHWLQHESRMMGVSLQLIDRLVHEESGAQGFSLAEMYRNANLVTYPSLYEGFGNALIEAVYYKCPVVVNRYPVYNCDIRPLGFHFIELDGYVGEETIQLANEVILSREKAREVAETNYEIARTHFSMEVLKQKLLQVL